MGRWHSRPSFAGRGDALRDWLREPGSLTARLLLCGTFRVQVLRQRRWRANADECAVLGVTPRTPCWVREVVLFCDGAPVVFAHTVLPALPRGALGRWFARLGSRSLGSLLFTHPGFSRGRLTFSRLAAGHPLYAPAAAALGFPATACAARRCIHRLAGQAVLVTEVFSDRLADCGGE